MPITPVPEMMDAARAGGYAVGYFESWSIDSLQGVIDAAEKVRAPVIIGFNGEFLSHDGRTVAERLALYGALGRSAAEAASVPCGFIFNECAQDDWIRDACRCGFNLVMPADPSATPDDYRSRVRELTSYAHSQGVAVEAEIGELPCGSSGEVEGDGAMTDPIAAAAFVAETQVDLLAVSVGNVHIRLAGQQPLDIGRLSALRAALSIPFVLHGGTGIPSTSLREAIELGVTKVNYGTYIKQAYLAAIRAALGTDETNPHELLGLGGSGDLLVAGRRAVCDAVLARIGDLGCCGKA